MEDIKAAVKQFLDKYENKVIEGRQLKRYKEYLFDGYYRYCLMPQLFPRNETFLVNYELDVLPWHGYDTSSIDKNEYQLANNKMSDYNRFARWIAQGNGYDGEHLPIDFSKLEKVLMKPIGWFATTERIDEFYFNPNNYRSISIVGVKLLRGLKCHKLDMHNFLLSSPQLIAEAMPEGLDFDYVLLDSSSYSLSGTGQYNFTNKQFGIFVAKCNIRMIVIKDNLDKGNTKILARRMQIHFHGEPIDIRIGTETDKSLQSKVNKLRLLDGPDSRVVYIC